MAGVVTHLYIASVLLKKGVIRVERETDYYLGTIAPDAIMSKKNYQRDDKKISHLRENISSDRWYQDKYKDLFNSRMTEFYNSYVSNKSNDFALGYFVHLLTDQAFHYSFRDDIVKTLKYKKLPYEGVALRDAIIHELDTLDYTLLDENKWIYDLLENTRNICSNFEMDGLISSNMLCKNFEWIIQKYFKEYKIQEPIHFDSSKRSQLLEFIITHIEESFSSIKK